jgi:phenylacetate-coenzyme A ligase PaaK-like adenylate-forming protein
LKTGLLGNTVLRKGILSFWRNSFEVVNPDTGEAVPDGQVGEVVFTTLTRDAMPLLRYRTGDIAAFSSTPCVCGTFLKTMKRVLGRIDNKVIIGENKFLFLRELDEVLLKSKEVWDYKAYITDENLLKIEIVSEDQSNKNDARQSIQTLLYEKLGYNMNSAVIVNPDRKPEKIINSMVKRNISDCRGAGI